VPFFTYIRSGCEADEFALLLEWKFDLAHFEIFPYLFLSQSELAASVAREPAHEIAQFETATGLDHDLILLFGNRGFMMLEETERIHPAVPNQHVPFASRLFDLWF
jgi:hypothetical protein